MGRWRRCSGWLVCCVEGGAAPSPMVSEAPARWKPQPACRVMGCFPRLDSAFWCLLQGPPLFLRTLAQYS